MVVLVEAVRVVVLEKLTPNALDNRGGGGGGGGGASGGGTAGTGGNGGSGVVIISYPS